MRMVGGDATLVADSREVVYSGKRVWYSMQKKKVESECG